MRLVDVCDVCGDQFSDLAGHKALGTQTHPWLLAGRENKHRAWGEVMRDVIVEILLGHLRSRTDEDGRLIGTSSCSYSKNDAGEVFCECETYRSRTSKSELELIKNIAMDKWLLIKPRGES